MSEYIKREDVLALKGNCYDKDGHLLYAVGTGDIMRIPPADVVEVRHGRWEHDGSEWKYRFLCSECGYKLMDVPTNYCPNCGARMDGEEQENE